MNNNKGLPHGGEVQNNGNLSGLRGKGAETPRTKQEKILPSNPSLLCGYNSASGMVEANVSTISLNTIGTHLAKRKMYFLPLLFYHFLP